MYGWDTYFEGFIIETKNKERLLAFGITMRNIHIDDIVDKFFGYKLQYTSWMSELAVSMYTFIIKQFQYKYYDYLWVYYSIYRFPAWFNLFQVQLGDVILQPMTG